MQTRWQYNLGDSELAENLFSKSAEERGKKASRGPAKGAVAVLAYSSLQWVIWMQTPKEGSNADQDQRGPKAGRNNQYDEIQIEELTNIKMSSTGWNKELDQRKNWMGINVKSFI